MSLVSEKSTEPGLYSDAKSLFLREGLTRSCWPELGRFYRGTESLGISPSSVLMPHNLEYRGRGSILPTTLRKQAEEEE